MQAKSRFRTMVETVRRRLADEAGLVDRAVDDSARAFLRQDRTLAERVLRAEALLDRDEVEIERLCLDALVLEQPLAADLRFVAAAIKVNADLERAGDLATSVAKQSSRLAQPPPPEFEEPFADLADEVRRSMRSAVDALLRLDADLARKVWLSDVRADERLREILDLVLRLVKSGRLSVEDAAACVAAARNMERIGDHATNVAEDVVFVVEGRIVRHNFEASMAPLAPPAPGAASPPVPPEVA